MKKIVSFALAMAMALTLTACGGGGGKEPAPMYELSDAQAMVDAGAFSEELEEVDADTAFALYKLADYGLEREDLVDCAVLRSAGATCEEVAILQIGGEGEEPVDRAKQALEDYVEAQIAANADYRPDEIPKLENALVEAADRSVLLVVASDMQAAQAAVE